MPNDTDTDVLDSTSADSVLAGGGADKSSGVLAGGGADPGADVSSDIGGAPANLGIGSGGTMPSPLGGQQPGQAPAGGIGPGAQQAPVGAGIHARHGGLLTGLAGVLLDGIAAGIMTPQSGQGFSDAARAAYNMPLQRQQQAMQMQQFQTQQELDKAQISMAHVRDLQARALATKLTDEQIAGYTDEEVKTHDQLEEQGAVDQIAKVPTREEASQHLNQIAIQDPANRQNYWMWPTGHDGQGNITGWGIYKMDPDKPIGPGHTLYLLSRDPTTGEESFKPVPLDPKMPVLQFNMLKTESVLGRMMQDAAKPPATGTPSLLYDQQGNIIGSYTPPKTGGVTAAPAGLPGKTAAGVKIGTATAQQAGTANLAFNSFGRYQQSFRNLSPRLTETDRQALQVLTSHQAEIASNLIGYSESAIADLLTGKPLTGYSEKLMTGAMTREQYEKLSPAAQQMLADYSHAIVANFAVMKQRLGTAGARNQAMVQAEMNNIPLPYIPLTAAEKLFGDTLEDMRSYAGGGTPGAGGGTVAPSVGEVRRGYRFKGGDPSQKANWEAVQ